MANETILRNGFIAKAASEVEGTLGAEALAVINSSGVTQFTLPTADGTGGYAMTTNGSGTLSWSAIPSITGLISDITAESIFDLSDVNETDATIGNNELLQWNGSAFVGVAATSIGTTTLAGLNDTTITSAVDGDFLRHNGTAWVDSAIQTGDITSGMVIQHEGDLSIAIGQVTGFTPSDYIPTTQKGAANGVATLDGSGLVPSTQLPSYVDDIVEFDQPLATPGSPVTGDLPSGETASTGKLYVDTASDAVYRWSGSAFVNVTDFATPDHNIDTHGDVNITSIASGEILQWDGTEWINQTLSELNMSIGDLSDVDITTSAPTNEQVLAWNSTDSEFQPISVSALSQADSISSLTDTTTTTYTAGDILYYKDATDEWVNANPSVAGIVIDSDIANMVETTDSVTVLSDVSNIGSDGDIIVNSGGNLVGTATITSSKISDFESSVDTILAATTLSELLSGSITDLDEVASVGTNGQILVSDGTDLVATDFTDWKENSQTLATDAASDIITAESLVGSYGAITLHYSLSNGTDMRMGTLMVITDGSTVELTDISTNQIGSDADEPVFSATTSGSNLAVKVTDANGYTVKSTYRLING